MFIDFKQLPSVNVRRNWNYSIYRPLITLNKRSIPTNAHYVNAGIISDRLYSIQTGSSGGWLSNAPSPKFWKGPNILTLSEQQYLFGIVLCCIE